MVMLGIGHLALLTLFGWKDIGGRVDRGVWAAVLFALTNSGADLRPKRDSAAPLYAFPGLETVRQPLATMGSTAATMLLQLINGQNPHGTHLQLAIELIVRHHAGPRGALSNSNGCSGFSRRHTSDADIGCKAVVQCLFIHSCKQ